MLKRLICFTLVFIYLFSFLTYANPFIDEANKYEDDTEDNNTDIPKIDISNYISDNETFDEVLNGNYEITDPLEFYDMVSKAEFLGDFSTNGYSSRSSNASESILPDKYFPMSYKTNASSLLHSNRLWSDPTMIPAKYAGGYDIFFPTVDLKGSKFYVFVSDPEDPEDKPGYYIISCSKNGLFNFEAPFQKLVGDGRISSKSRYHGGYLLLNKSHFPRGVYSMMFQCHYASGFSIYPLLEFLMFNKFNHVSPNFSESYHTSKYEITSPTRERLSLVTYPYSGSSTFNYSTDGEYTKFFLNIALDSSNADELVFRFIGDNEATYSDFPRWLRCSLRFDVFSGSPSIKLPSRNKDEMQADAFNSMNESLSSVAEGQNLVLEKMQELIQHISDQLFAFWNQLAGEFTNLYAKLEKKHSDDTNALVESISNMTNKIVNQSKENTKKEIENENRNHDEALHGFDNNTMNDDKSRLDASLDNYNQAEDELMGEITNNLNDFTFNKNIFTSFVEPIKGCSLFLSALFDASDILQNYILFVLAITVATIFIGLYRFRG